MSADLQVLNNLKCADEITKLACADEIIKRVSLSAEQVHALNADCFDEMRPEHVAKAIGISDIASFFYNKVLNALA